MGENTHRSGHKEKEFHHLDIPPQDTLYSNEYYVYKSIKQKLVSIGLPCL
jgi:hypothetical protein